MSIKYDELITYPKISHGYYRSICESYNFSKLCHIHLIVAMLEWKASRKKAGLAVEAEFSDSEKVQGQVESWTTAEEFTANLLKHRYWGTKILVLQR